MKIYRASFWDDGLGNLLSWHGSKAEAERWVRAEQRERNMEKGAGDISIVDIPTDKAGLLRWLNNNFDLDNG